MEFCPPDNTDEPEVEGVCYNNGYQDEKGNGTVGVKLNFLVDKGTVESDTYLFVNLTGKDVKTKIKGQVIVWKAPPQLCLLAIEWFIPSFY